MAAALFKRAYHIGRGAGGGYAYHGVFVVDAELLQVEPALFGVVFGIFHGMTQGVVAAGYDAYHPARVHAECGRYLGSVEHAEAARCAGSHIEYASAAAHTLDDGRDKFFNLGYCLLYGNGYFFVLVIYVMEELSDRFLFEIIVKRRFFADFVKHNVWNLDSC